MDNSLFRMNDTVDIDNVVNDFQHKVTGVMDKYKDSKGFPRVEDYGVSRESVDDYLFDKQAALDSEGTERSRYTLAGVIIVLPIVAVALFPAEKLPFGEYTVLPAMLIGVLLYAVVHAIRKMLIRVRIRNLDCELPQEKRYVDAVLEYSQKNSK